MRPLSNFSPEQIMLDLDIGYTNCRFTSGIGGDRFKDSLELIREKGIRYYGSP